MFDHSNGSYLDEAILSSCCIPCTFHNVHIGVLADTKIKSDSAITTSALNQIIATNFGASLSDLGRLSAPSLNELFEHGSFGAINDIVDGINFWRT